MEFPFEEHLIYRLLSFYIPVNNQNESNFKPVG